MISGLFIFMVILAGVFAIYALIRNDRDNYTDILMAFVSAIIFILCGFELMAGVTHYAGATMTVTISDGWMAMVFILLGAIMILYAAVRVFDIAKDMMAQLEGGEA
jgi:TRAP-type C4-dicarboxylate transport system permease small subunit